MHKIFKDRENSLSSTQSGNNLITGGVYQLRDQMQGNKWKTEQS